MKNKKKIVSAFFQEVWNEKMQTHEVYSNYFSENVISEALIGKKFGVHGLKNMVEEWLFSFPDFTVDLLQLEEYKNIVTLKARGFGHHSQRYRHVFQEEHSLLENSSFIKKITDIEPKGNKISSLVDGIFIFEKEKIVFCDISSVDLMDLFQQLGCFLEAQKYPRQDIFCQNFRELSKKLQNLSTPPLSPKEIECLCLNLNGFSAKQIGLLMSISYRTVQTHIQHSLDKLQCFNKYQCFEMMYEKGFLPIWQDFFNLLLKRYPSFY